MIYEVPEKCVNYDLRTENPLDVVVQHMVAAGFSFAEIKDMIHVTEDFIKAACTPSM